MTDIISVLEQQERDLVFDAFDHADAWRLGSRLAAMASEAGHPVGIDIRRPGLILFRAALPGSTPDQESWIARKSAVVLRLESSSALAKERHQAKGVDAAATGWLDAADYAVTGGSFPVRVRGIGVVAAVTVSGLSSMDDHELVVAGIRAHLGR
ncbi:heme-degrading domain-containing protein [Glycomyces terrestris]|uniref:Heme-degrading domain-containing protein n=1 Tax=Glycomyces terrestris TaxID=2493553 RepID=A0A426UUW1_9ACTN|nr:heme-degrading domain-containing protein [Glycomyces terrestris]RRR98100.1 heme-degrading domain-containing protein [Glycomyces terrestris]